MMLGHARFETIRARRQAEVGILAVELVASGCGQGHELETPAPIQAQQPGQHLRSKRPNVHPEPLPDVPAV